MTNVRRKVFDPALFSEFGVEFFKNGFWACEFYLLKPHL